MKSPQKIALLLISLIPASALATSGRTADGCTYKVINGQYLTDCSKKVDEIKTKASAPEETSSAPNISQENIQPSNTTVTSYDSIPLREKTIVSNDINAPTSAPAILPVPVSRPGSYTPSDNRENKSREKLLSIHERKHYDDEIERPIGEQSYLSVLAASTSFKEAKSDSSLGLALAVGSNLNNHFGMELGYSYAKQGMNLGLANRSGANTSFGNNLYNSNDANLSSHILSVDAQGHLTGIESKFRPFLGLGLGWKSSTLQEKKNTNQSYSFSPNYSEEEASLKQTSFGALASAGLKFRAGKNLLIAVSYRYFAPFSRNTATLNNPNQYYSYDPSQGSSLNLGDEKLTSSAQQQLMGGIQYIF